MKERPIIFTTYPGGKAGSGVYQTIINQIPPHEIYIEPFLGGGAILRFKRLASLSIGVDADAAVLRRFEALYCRDLPENRVLLYKMDGIAYLQDCEFTKRPSTFVYADPPYLLETRSSGRLFYDIELATTEEHTRLLEALLNLRCMVAISGYPSELYDRMLVGWRKIEFPAMTRGGRVATECLWMNYPEPLELHDYRYLGDNFRERERITRKKLRWRRRLERMDRLERFALLDTIQELWKKEKGITYPEPQEKWFRA